jgi:hypothetical protein
MERRELTELQRELAAQGWRFEERKKGVLFFAPDGSGMVMVHRTTSDWRGDLNALKEFERLGFKPRKGRRKR